jgi:hypothetical protein
VQEHNNDVAITILHPLPAEQLNFEDIRNALVDFLNVQMGIPTLTVQPCPHGQAYVRFSHFFHCDLLIQNSPHHFGHGTISFIAHNRAWNNRTTVFTHEVWLMLIGLNLDLWTHPLVDKAISQFGKLIVWEEDQNHLATVLVKARVSGLDAIPWFFNFTEGSDPESDCWTAQCEILLTRLLGAQAQDEDFPPEDPDVVDPNHFDFHGFGQPVHPGQGPHNHPNGPHNPFDGNAANGLNVAWAPWPHHDNDLNFATQVQNQQLLPEAQGGNNVLAEAQDEAPPLIPLQPEPVMGEIINPQGADHNQDIVDN